MSEKSRKLIFRLFPAVSRDMHFRYLPLGRETVDYIRDLGGLKLERERRSLSSVCTLQACRRHPRILHRDSIATLTILLREVCMRSHYIKFGHQEFVRPRTRDGLYMRSRSKVESSLRSSRAARLSDGYTQRNDVAAYNNDIVFNGSYFGRCQG